MKYYHRYDTDGTCEVICTGCFRTLGRANGITAVRGLEAHHICNGKAIRNGFADEGFPSEQPISILNRIRNFLDIARDTSPLNVFAVFFTVALFLYALPTLAEFAAAAHLNPWLAAIFPGDAAGCAGLIFIFKRYRTGIFLYAFLTTCESCLHLLHIITADTLPWVVDIVPTVIVAGLILRARWAGTMRQTILG